MKTGEDPIKDVAPAPNSGALPGGLVDTPNVEAQGQLNGPECPTCGDRFPSKESLDQHLASEHKP